MSVLRLEVLVLGWALVASRVQAAEILGSVVDKDRREPVRGVVVKAVGIGSDPTTDTGDFSIKVDASRIGRRVTLEVVSDRWAAVPGQNLDVIVAADALENPVRIIVQKAGRSVANVNTGGITADFSVLTEDPQGTLGVSYSATRSGPDIHIVPKAPYVDLFRAGGPIYPLGDELNRQPEFPQLDIKVANNTGDTLFFTRADLQIERSAIDQSPLLAIPKEGYRMTVPLRNLGWGNPLIERLDFNLTDTNVPDDFSQSPKYTQSINRTGDMEIDVSPQFAALGVDVDFFRNYLGFGPPLPGREVLTGEALTARIDKARGPFRNSAAKLTGQIVYRDPASQTQRAVKLSVIVNFFPEGVRGPAGISARYRVAIDSEGSNYVRSVDLSQALHPKDFDRFTIGIAAPKSSSHRFRVRLFYNGGKFIESPWILLDLYNPRR